jgi:hypothetical protein
MSISSSLAPAKRKGTYYVTDYIIKFPLPMHIGLSAIRVATQKKFESHAEVTIEEVSKSLFMK